MRIAGYVLWLALTALLAAVIALLSDIPIWAAALMASIAMLANSWVLADEDRQPGGLDNPDGTPAPNNLTRILFRVAGALLGTLSIGLGIFSLQHPFSSYGWWSAYVVPTCIIVTGVFFAHYGVTGRSRLFRRK